MTSSFDCVTILAVSPAAAFDLSLDVDAHTASMARSRERAIGAITSGRLGLGDDVTWQARHLGRTWTMTSTITEWDRPERFQDEQSRGPFAFFRHEHIFEPSHQGTRMTDRITFQAPLGPIGGLAERLILTRYLRRLIEERNEFLRRTATQP